MKEKNSRESSEDWVSAIYLAAHHSSLGGEIQSKTVQRIHSVDSSTESVDLLEMQLLVP